MTKKKKNILKISISNKSFQIVFIRESWKKRKG